MFFLVQRKNLGHAPNIFKSTDHLELEFLLEFLL